MSSDLSEHQRPQKRVVVINGPALGLASQGDRPSVYSQCCTSFSRQHIKDAPIWIVLSRHHVSTWLLGHEGRSQYPLLRVGRPCPWDIIAPSTGILLELGDFHKIMAGRAHWIAIIHNGWVSTRSNWLFLSSFQRNNASLNFKWSCDMKGISVFTNVVWVLSHLLKLMCFRLAHTLIEFNSLFIFWLTISVTHSREYIYIKKTIKVPFG